MSTQNDAAPALHRLQTIARFFAQLGGGAGASGRYVEGARGRLTLQSFQQIVAKASLSAERFGRWCHDHDYHIDQNTLLAYADVVASTHLERAQVGVAAD